jgi:AraC-like DNA-binding protein
MQYQKFRPQELLSPFVECYFTWESNGPLEKELVVESPPSGFCSLVINCGSPYFLQNKKYERLAVPQQFVSGQSIYSYKLFLSDIIKMAGIVFKPAGLSTFWGLDSFEFTEERAELFTVLHQDYVRKYVDQIKQVEEGVEKVKLMEELLLHHYKLTKPEPDYIDKAANTIVEKWGMLHVQQLIKESCMSRRTFERRFFQKVGLSPKYYARIRRIGYVCSLFIGKKKVNWPEIFYEAGFYDQAHFIKDFEEFTGRTPQQYLNENVELANFVEKPKVQSLPQS